MLPEIKGENEVSLEWFSRLKEYDSLSRNKLKLQKAMKDEEERLSALDQRREEKMSQLTNLKSDYVRFQQELHDIEEKMKVLNQQRQRWIDQGGDENKRLMMEKELAALEDKGMKLLEDLDLNEGDRKDAQTFLEGLKKTRDEIAGEVGAEIKKLQEEISQLDLRLGSLLEMLPPEFKDLLQRILKKNLTHGPFTRIEAGACFFCRYKISRVDESEIDMQQKLKTCPQCSRIFIPYGT
jgi:predicted  nucleic acid-binding Zn-ribbon protein